MNRVRIAQSPRRAGVALAIILVAALIGGPFLVGPSGSAVLAQGGEPLDVLAQDSGGTIYFDPNPAYVNLGGTVSVKVCLADVENIYGIDLRFTFEDEKVSFVPVPVIGWAVLPLWEVFDEYNNYIIKHSVTKLDGTPYSQVWYAVTNTDPAVPFTGDGCICSVTFKGEVAGTTPLHFTYVLGSTLNGGGLESIKLDGSITVRDPTAVTISRFVARPAGRSVRVSWSTEQETELLGFNLYRADDSGDDPVRLNDALIPARQPGSPAGARYQFVDRAVESGVMYDYWLEAVQVDGTTERLGPESAAAALNLLDPPIQ